jgi:hypothetical protein
VDHLAFAQDQVQVHFLDDLPRQKLAG